MDPPFLLKDFTVLGLFVLLIFIFIGLIFLIDFIDFLRGFRYGGFLRYNLRFITNLPAASAPFWMFASVVVVCLTAIYLA